MPDTEVPADRVQFRRPIPILPRDLLSPFEVVDSTLGVLC